MRYVGEPLEADFVVATWDQRGTGRSADTLEPASTLTLDQMVADTIEVTEYLCDRFDEDAVYVVGSSWGTTLGVLAVQQRPDLFHAYVGTGQMVGQLATDRLMYADSLAYAERRATRASPTGCGRTGSLRTPTPSPTRRRWQPTRSGSTTRGARTTTLARSTRPVSSSASSP